MLNRVLACAIAVVILGLVGYQYLNTRHELQKQYRRVTEQLEISKAQEQKIGSQQQQIESLQQQVKQNEALQERVARLERQFRAQAQAAEESAEVQPPRPRTLRIFPLWTYPPSHSGQGCGPAAHPCDVFELGTDVQIVVVLSNPSGQTITFRHIRWWPSTVLEVRDQSGHLLPETEELRQLKEKWFHDGEWTGPPVVHNQPWTGPSIDDVGMLRPHLGAGQSGQISWGVNVSKHYDFSRTGKYSIVAKMLSSYPAPKWFESNKIWVTIIPRQSSEQRKAPSPLFSPAASNAPAI